MWNQPATARQIAALKASGNFDGKYYSRGRAGQTIGESRRSGAGTSGSAFAAREQRPPQSAASGTNELARLAELVGTMRPEPDEPEMSSPQVVVGHVVGREGHDVTSQGNCANPGGVLSMDFIEHSNPVT